MKRGWPNKQYEKVCRDQIYRCAALMLQHADNPTDLYNAMQDFSPGTQRLATERLGRFKGLQAVVTQGFVVRR